jgi:RNA-directed DNA polymerase
LWQQYRACRHHKRGTVNALRFELNAEENLLALQQELRDHTYRPGPSICFVTHGPKPREVFAADFRDRVVHQLLVSWQQPVHRKAGTVRVAGAPRA